MDEAGRGAWAGPLVAAAVRLPDPEPALLNILEGVRDSKLLTPAARSRLFYRIIECASDVGLGVVSPDSIDDLGLRRAGELAMTWAVEDMAEPPDCLLTDYFSLPACAIRQRPVVHGDRISLSIAAASIIAKVSRDRLMQSADRVFPGYGFRLHKGYGTDVHSQALLAHGPSSYHRRSFGPVGESEEDSQP